MLGCYLISFHFLWVILPIRPVLVHFSKDFNKQTKSHNFPTHLCEVEVVEAVLVHALPGDARTCRTAHHGPDDGLLFGVDHRVLRPENEGRRLAGHDRDDDGTAGRIVPLRVRIT